MSDGWYEHVPNSRDENKITIRVLAPTPGRAIYAVLLGGPIWERMLHFTRMPTPRTYPCLLERCVWCPNVGRRPTGYVAAVTRRDLRPCVLQLSDAALAQYDRLAQSQGDLRGVCVVTQRQDARRNSKQLLAADGRYDGKFPLPDAWDPRPTLELMWGSAAYEQIVHRPAGEPTPERQERQERQEERE